MGYKIKTPMTASVEKVVTDSYATDDLDITNFVFNPRSNVIAFSLRLNRTDGIREERDFTIPVGEVDELIAANVEAFRAVRAACFSWLVAQGEIPEGVDTWPSVVE